MQARGLVPRASFVFDQLPSICAAVCVGTASGAAQNLDRKICAAVWVRQASGAAQNLGKYVPCLGAFTLLVMRRILLLLVGLLLAACGETVVSGEQMTQVESEPVDAGPDADLEPVGTTTVEVADTEAPTTVPATVAPLPTGREALAVAQAEGRPVVLWFWGAH